MSNQVRLFENQIQHQDIKIINKPVKKKNDQNLQDWEN